MGCCRLRLGLSEVVPPDEDPALPVDVWPRWPLTHRCVTMSSMPSHMPFRRVTNSILQAQGFVASR